jgi:S-adenosylmethionine decarboxylase
MPALGKHVLLDLRGCTPAALSDVTALREIVCDAARAAGATILHVAFNEFQPHGISGVVVIAESHLTIHTWPEFGLAAVDIFTCGRSLDGVSAVRHLVERLEPARHSLVELDRCLLDVEDPPPEAHGA